MLSKKKFYSVRSLPLLFVEPPEFREARQYFSWLYSYRTHCHGSPKFTNHTRTQNQHLASCYTSCWRSDGSAWCESRPVFSAPSPAPWCCFTLTHSHAEFGFLPVKWKPAAWRWWLRVKLLNSQVIRHRDEKVCKAQFVFWRNIQRIYFWRE